MIGIVDSNTAFLLVLLRRVSKPIIILIGRKLYVEMMHCSDFNQHIFNRCPPSPTPPPPPPGGEGEERMQFPSTAVHDLAW